MGPTCAAGASAFVAAVAGGALRVAQPMANKTALTERKANRFMAIVRPWRGESARTTAWSNKQASRTPARNWGAMTPSVQSSGWEQHTGRTTSVVIRPAKRLEKLRLQTRFDGNEAANDPQRPAVLPQASRALMRAHQAATCGNSVSLAAAGDDDKYSKYGMKQTSARENVSPAR